MRSHGVRGRDDCGPGAEVEGIRRMPPPNLESKPLNLESQTPTLNSNPELLIAQPPPYRRSGGEGG